LKVLVVGLGGIGQRHVRNLRSLAGDGLALTAYRVRRTTPLLTDTLGVESSDGVESRYGVRSLDSLDDALAERPDAVLVCNPTSLHIAIAQAAAEAGSHLLVEKPLADTLEGVDRLIETVEQRNLVALVAYQWRFHPLLLRVKQILEEGTLGNIVAVEAHIGEYLPLWHKYEDYRDMYASRRDQGGGVILTQIHEMDYLLWLFGVPSRIVAMGGRRSRLEIDVEDTASILMDFGGVPVQLHQDYLQNPPRRTLQVVGDLGKLVADLLAPHLTVFREGSMIEEATYEGFQRNDMFRDEMRHFLECIEGRATPVVSLRDGAMSLRMALAARESLETGRVLPP
jgi:predicted dehydrogenase